MAKKVYLQDVRKEVMTVYLEYMKEFNIPIRYTMELLRYSICVSLDLDTKEASDEVRGFSVSLIKKLRKIFKDFRINSMDIEKRQGILEMCVHTISITLKKAGMLYE